MVLNIPFPSVPLAHLPTPLEPMKRLSKKLNGAEIWIKRDDCTGLAMGGNKARQLEYYLGQAVEQGADTILTTGAVQSNHVRMTIAAARKLGMKVEVQLEKRVSGRQPEYYQSGNPLLMKIMGATIHTYPEGEDEDGADKALYDIAELIRQKGGNPYVVPLAGNHVPYGALGYVQAAEEIINQMNDLKISFDAIVVASGSANTHAGILVGLKMMGSTIKVLGSCVRRSADLQVERVKDKANKVAKMLGKEGLINDADIHLTDAMLAPGYGQLNASVKESIKLTAENEAILLDPTYTGKSMASLIDQVRQNIWSKGQKVLFIHTGGSPALFGYPELIEDD